jgi:hypothetical protein
MVCTGSIIADGQKVEAMVSQLNFTSVNLLLPKRGSTCALMTAWIISFTAVVVPCNLHPWMCVDTERPQKDYLISTSQGTGCTK